MSCLLHKSVNLQRLHGSWTRGLSNVLRSLAAKYHGLRRLSHGSNYESNHHLVRNPVSTSLKQFPSCSSSPVVHVAVPDKGRQPRFNLMSRTDRYAVATDFFMRIIKNVYMVASPNSRFYSGYSTGCTLVCNWLGSSSTDLKTGMPLHPVLMINP